MKTDLEQNAEHWREIATAQAATLERVRDYEQGKAWDADGCPMSLAEILAALGSAPAQTFKERFGLPEPAPAQAELDWTRVNLELALVKLKAAETKSDVDYQGWRKADSDLQAAEARCAKLTTGVSELQAKIFRERGEAEDRLLVVEARCAGLELQLTKANDPAQAEITETELREIHAVKAKCNALELELHQERTRRKVALSRISELEADVRAAHRSHAEAVNAANARCAELERQLKEWEDNWPESRKVATPGQAAVLKAMELVGESELRMFVSKFAGGLSDACETELARRKSES